MTSIFSIASQHVEQTSNVAANMNNRMLVEENRRLQEQVAEGRRKIQNLAKQLSAASADVAKSVKSVAKYDSLEDSLRDCAEERDQLKYDLNKNVREKEEMKTLIGKLQEQVAEMEKTHHAQIENSNEKNDALKDLLESVSAKAVEMTSRKEAVESNFIASQQKVQELQDDLSELKQKDKLLLQDVKSLTADKVQATKDIGTLKGTIKNNEGLRKQLESKIATLAYEKQSVEKELKAVTLQQQKLVTFNTTLKSTLVARDKTIQSQTDRIQQLESEKSRRIAELERVNNKLGMVSHSHDIALAEIEDLKDSLKRAEHRLEQQEIASQKVKENLQLQLQESSNQKAELSNDLKATVDNLMSTREQVAELKDEVADREQKIQEEKKKLAELGCSEKIQVLNGGKITSITEGYFWASYPGEEQPIICKPL